MSIAHPVTGSFQETFCAQYGVLPELYDATVLRLTLYPHARWLAGMSPLAFLAPDRSFIARDMPMLDAFLHYRSVDVSTMKELVRRWYPDVYANGPKKVGSHRALGDIRESIDELRYYRQTVFRPAEKNA